MYSPVVGHQSRMEDSLILHSDGGLLCFHGLLHTNNIVIEDITELAPAFLRNGDGSAEVSLHFADPHVDSPVVLGYSFILLQDTVLLLMDTVVLHSWIQL